jgi:hypothetical protein
MILFLDLSAQESKLNVDFDIRYRFESWNNMNVKYYGESGKNQIGSVNDDFLLQRIITGFDFKPTEDIEMSLHLQDSRAFGWSLSNNQFPDAFKVGDNKTSNSYYIKNPNEEFFELYDLSFKFSNILNNMSIIAGRQKISFGDNKIFGPGEWGNSGRWNWDAIKVEYLLDDLELNFWTGGTKINDPNVTSIPFFNTEYYGIGSYDRIKVSNNLHFEPFLASKWQGSADFINKQNINRYWIGGRLIDSNYYNFDYDITLTKEFGKENGKKIDASGLSSRIGYKFKLVPWSPLFSLRYIYASGGENENEINDFDPVYGSRDKYYGRMNIFTWSNLSNYEICLELFPKKELYFEIKYNSFFIPYTNNIAILKNLKLQEGKNYMGSEIDLWVEYKLLKNLNCNLVGGYFIPGDVENIDGKKAKNASWFALQFFYHLNYVAF